MTTRPQPPSPPLGPKSRRLRPATSPRPLGSSTDFQLTVSDRRLLIKGTNLAELTDGVATALGDMLARLDQDLHSEQDERVAAGEAVHTERQRFDAVSQAAAKIRFGTTRTTT